MAWKARRDIDRDRGGASSDVPFQVQGKVGRVDDPPPAVFLKRYVQANRPVVIGGAMDEWPALRRWSWEYLAATAGDCSGEVVVSRNGLYPDYLTQPSPEFRRAAALECRLRQGDTLFLPSNWWHEVETLEPSISVQLAFAGGTVTSELAVLSDLVKTRRPEELMNEPAVQRLLQDPAMMQAVLRMMAGAGGR